MKKIALLSLFLLVYIHCFAQNSQQDSLKKTIRKANKAISDAQKALSKLDNSEPVVNPEISGGNTIYRYNAQVISTNFTIPILRVNFLAPSAAAAQNAKASASFFNSIGAGLGYNFGKLERTLDQNGKLVTQEITNIFGIQVGCLFAASGGTGNTTNSSTTTGGSTSSTTTSGNGSSNIFALTGAITILNFQFGAGYELGTIVSGQRRGFATIAYSIPLSALVKGSFLITHKSPIANSKINDYQYELQ